ncbi:HAMP domain-containing protein [Hoyosella sp. G463]|uniref:HAMP domain-containing protein n=1 Tax=Lolliginicoccus lacisalsi TaxID=2742202 RepID=A0A927JEW9_9ACTN|nr:adenylate/guanylate cyclase domain-containing protein [Lolliginicoccus lacisalsi]MBD8507928.1 HAMP domain-containing protein [Lolliginicoccus lacisalsi]
MSPVLPSTRSPLGSWLLGRENEGRTARRIRVQLLLTLFLVSANIIGIAIVLVLIIWVVPGPEIMQTKFLMPNLVGVPVFIGAALLLGIVWGTRRALKDLRWSRTGDAPTKRQRRIALATPWRLTFIQLVLWSTALVVFTVWYGSIEPEILAKVAFTLASAGIVVCAIAYLLSEFALRPVAAEVLSYGDSPGRRAGAISRSMVSWIVGTGVPVSGLMVIALAATIRDDATITSLIVSILALGAIVLFFGGFMELLNTSRTIAPVRVVRHAMRKIEKGDLDARVVVFDGSELGDLQVGFNRMAEGLRERERIRDLFGRHVGRAVADHALDHDAELGGEERSVAVFFIDLIGSTRLATQLPPTEVVALLNRFFAVVVEEVDRNGGFINKFEGDAALAIFGAPVEIDDAPGAALRAARTIMKRLEREVPDCEAGIGVACGVAVAGNVGAHERFEYTVIGDPVNEAARLSDEAKKVPGRIAASGDCVESAGPREARKWRTEREVQLRGREALTVVSVPRKAAAEPIESA